MKEKGVDQQFFASRGLRCTRQRLALYQALCDTSSHPTVDELYNEAKKQAPSISLATVYNTLEAFCRAGIAQKLPATGSSALGAGSARYDATAHNHLHVRCNKTGTVRDVPHRISRQVLDHIPPKLLKEIESQMGFKIDQVQVDLIGKNSSV